MTKKSNFYLYMLIWVIGLLIFNAFCFLPPDVKDYDNFWVGYIFITVMFLAHLGISYFAFSAKSDREVFYNFPIIKASYGGLVAMVAIGSLVMVIEGVPNWVGVLLCLVIVALTAVSLVKATVVSGAVKDTDERVKNQTLFIRMLTVNAQTLVAGAHSEEVRSLCNKVYEAARYSDPMSNPALAAVEGQISLRFNDLSSAVSADNVETVKRLVSDLEVLLQDRNAKCKLLK